MKRLLLSFTLFSLVFFLGLFIYLGVVIRVTRDQNMAGMYNSFTQAKTEAVSSYLASGGFNTDMFKDRLNGIFSREPRVLFLAVYSDEDGILYLISKHRSYVEGDVESQVDWGGTPSYHLLPISEKVFTLPFSPAQRTDLNIDGGYVVLGRQDLYPILRNAFFVLLVFLLISAIFVLVITMIDPKRLEAKRSGKLRPVFSSSSGLVLADHFEPRLELELDRAADSGKDLAVILTEIDDFPARTHKESVYSQVAQKAVETFPNKDLAFEWQEAGCAVIFPDADIDSGIRRAETLRKEVESLHPEGQDVTVSIGLSARSARAVDAETLIVEARAAVQRAGAEGKNQVVAFRADPERYRKQKTN